MKKKKLDAMLLAAFFADCFYSATYPYICQQIKTLLKLYLNDILKSF